MNKTEMRSIALGAARSYLRRQGFAPELESADQALGALDDLFRKDPELIAAQWYATTTENQERLFIREWRKWCKQHQQAQGRQGR